MNTTVPLAAVLFIVLASLLTGAGCTSSHPASSLLRVSVLTSELVDVQNRCFSDKRRYCRFDEVPQPVLARWGDVKVNSASTATFEGYDLSLIFGNAAFCVGAVPVRMTNSFDAIWRDSQGVRYDVKHPWNDVPKPCRLAIDPKAGVR